MVTAGQASPRLRAVLPVLVVLVAGVAAAVSCAAHRPTVLLYGDSLADEAQHWFAASFPDSVRVEVHVLGGTAICDFLPGLPAELKRTRPVAVVFEFAGNGVTRCTQPTPGTAATVEQLVTRYRGDAASATRLVVAAGATAWWMGAPVNRDPTADIGNTAVRAVYQALPAQFPAARYVDAGAAVERAGQFTETLPCLPVEPCAHVGAGNENPVRAPDGGHLCPAHQPSSDACPVWSSGAFRFGMAMAEPVIRSLHLQPRRLTGS